MITVPELLLGVAAVGTLLSALTTAGVLWLYRGTGRGR